jgi:hypothetical protein
LDEARGAFFELRDPRGRRRGSGHFETGEDFESAVFAVVAGLHNQKRRITQDAVGAYLIKKHGRNATSGWHAGDSPRDPGRQFRLWCTAFERSPKDLLQRATAACANRE